MTNIVQNEEWRIIEFEDIHPDEKVFVSSFGRLRSFKTSRKGGKIIKGSWLSGYNIIVLKKGKDKRKTIFIHKIVAEYFHDKPSEDAEFVIHIDYNRKNNHFKNLRWVTRKEGVIHRRNDKEYDQKKVRNAKLTPKDVVAMKKMMKETKLRPFRIALKFGITQTQFNRIKSGENWGHINID
ncbi:MAG: HNH endonuclease [Bacteroidales bacterium]|nr:HNH endonuclease [Bacteroidales bacterium]